MIIMRLIFAIIAILGHFPAMAQQSCADLFVKTPPPSEFLASEDISPLFHDAFAMRPDLLGPLSDELLAQARQHLYNENISFREFQEWDSLTHRNYRVLVISPGPSKLGQFAEFIYKKYEAVAVFNSAKLLLLNAGAAVTLPTSLENGGVSNTLFYLNFKHILGGSSSRYFRDLMILHEIRHLDIFAGMINRVPSPLYGEAQVLRGAPPQDPAPNYAPYSTFLSFSELKTYHTEIKEQITALRKSVRLNQPANDQTRLLGQLFKSVDALNVVSARVIHFLYLL